MQRKPGTSPSNRGFFAIGIYCVRSEVNVGTLWRSAFQLNAQYIFTIGARYKLQSSDTTQTYRHIPLMSYPDWDAFHESRPYNTPLIGVEIGGTKLSGFTHPERGIYLLGAEDHGLPDKIIEHCQQVVEIDTLRSLSYNVAVAGSIIMFHRMLSRVPVSSMKGA